MSTSPPAKAKGAQQASAPTVNTFTFTDQMYQHMEQRLQKKQEEGPLGCPTSYTNKAKLHAFKVCLLGWNTAGSYAVNMEKGWKTPTVFMLLGTDAKNQWLTLAITKGQFRFVALSSQQLSKTVTLIPLTAESLGRGTDPFLPQGDRAANKIKAPCFMWVNNEKALWFIDTKDQEVSTPAKFIQSSLLDTKYPDLTAPTLYWLRLAATQSAEDASSSILSQKFETCKTALLGKWYDEYKDLWAEGQLGQLQHIFENLDVDWPPQPESEQAPPQESEAALQQQPEQV